MSTILSEKLLVRWAGGERTEGLLRFGAVPNLHGHLRNRILLRIAMIQNPAMPRNALRGA
jgi:hypothetical protein